MIRSSIRGGWAVWALACGAAFSGGAQETAPEDATAELRQAAEFLAAAPALSFDLKIRSVVDGPQGHMEAELSTSFLLGGRDKARIISKSADDEAIILSDGERRIVHFVTKNLYAEDAPPAERNQLISLIGGGPIRVGTSWTGELLHAHDGLFAGLQGVARAGVAPAPGHPEGASARHLVLSYDSFSADLYLAESGDPLPLYAEILFTAEQTGGPRVTVSLEYSNWNLQPDVSAERFAWSPPEGIQKYEPRPATPLVKNDDSFLGQAAPDFTLDSLDGKKVTLSSHEGEHIVLLDFWATWCGPCRMAMPVVDEVAKAYADKGVRLYAVNLREAPEKVQAFLDSARIEDMAVLMDTSGAVQQDYAANNIPRMVVVGKDGTIQAIHRGYSPQLKDTLSKQLDVLVSGVSLVEAKPS